MPNIEETRDLRFKRIAAKRTNEIIHKIQLLGNCSNRSAYDYSEEQINKIFSAIEKVTKEAKSRFSYTQKKKEFKL